MKSLIGWNGHKYVKREKLLSLVMQEPYPRYFRYIVKLAKKKKYSMCKVHRLVAEAFIPNPDELPQVNHIDGNALNNNVNNLEWVTNQDNIIHSYENLRTKKYDENILLEMINNNATPTEICEKLGVSMVVYYSTLKKIGMKPIGNKQWKNKYNINLDDLLQDFKNGLSNKELQEKYKCSPDIIATRKYQFRKQGLL